MHRMLIGGALAALCFAVPAVGQDNFDNAEIAQDTEENIVVPAIEPIQEEPVQQQMRDQEQITVTPEVYRNMQYKASPRELVHRRAALQGAQRRARIASREWYGISLSRPMANPLPHMGIYSPHWAGTYREPSLWLDQTYQNGYFHDYRDIQVFHGGIR